MIRKLLKRGGGGVYFADNIVPVPFETEYVNVVKNDNELTIENSGHILLKIDQEKLDNGELYVYFSGFESCDDDWDSIQIGKDKKIGVLDPQFIYYFGINNYLVNVETDDGVIDVAFPDENKRMFLDDIKVFLYEANEVEELINKLKSNSLYNVAYSSDMIEGDIDISQEGYLFFNIPYHTGWKVYVNGEKENLIKANIGFMAVKLTEGNYNIVLKYDSIWNKVGLYSTIVGIIGLLFLWKSGKQNKFIIDSIGSV